MVEIETIKRVAADVGFDLCGVAECRPFDAERVFFGQWLANGFGSSLDYLARNTDKRFDTAQLVEGAKSVAVCALSYKNDLGNGYPAECRTKVASYACAKDYHDVIKAMLRQMATALKAIYPSLSGRAFTDSAPILEKRYAVEAGLGWIGRQSLLVTPRFGTFVLIGELVLCEECDRYDEPLRTVGCGTCRRCVDACPNGAIKERHIDTSRCISCATIERGGADIPLHGWIFGCDECQSVCPYNKQAERSKSRALEPLFNPLERGADEWLAMTATEFAQKMSATPLSRSGLERIQANVRRNKAL